MRLHGLVAACLAAVLGIVAYSQRDSKFILEGIGSVANTTRKDRQGLEIVTQTLDLSPDDRICLFHVGKTGGSTVVCILGLHDNKCLEGSKNYLQFAEYRNRSALAALITTRSHVLWRCDEQSYKAGVILTRNPVDRFYSWFYYARRKSKFSTVPSRNLHYMYADCYRNMSDFVQGLATVPPYTITPSFANMTCPERAWAIAVGARTINTWAHNWYNYEYYFRRIMKVNRTMPIMVVRNEYMAVDWDSSERLLGATSGDGEALFSRRVNSLKYKTPHRAMAKKSMPSKSKAMAELGSDGIQLLCRALCDDIQYYKALVDMAINLTPQQKLDSLEELSESCPEQTISGVCPEMPSFALVPKTDEFVGNGKSRYYL